MTENAASGSTRVRKLQQGKVQQSKNQQGKNQQGWTQDPERVRRDILDVARQEFAQNGFSGARVDEIAARTATSKRMIYYYFGGKQGLYVAVLEEAYAHIRALETAVDLEALTPEDALTQLVTAMFDHHVANPWFVRLVMVENIHYARHLKQSQKIAPLNRTVIDSLGRIYDRGLSLGRFRPGIPPLQLHLTISALCFYNVSNRHSIIEGFGYDMSAPEAHVERRRFAIEAVLRFVAAD